MTPSLLACQSLKSVKKPLISLRNIIHLTHLHYVGLAGAWVTKELLPLKHRPFMLDIWQALAQRWRFATAEETIAVVRNGEADAVLADSQYLKPIVDEW